MTLLYFALAGDSSERMPKILCFIGIDFDGTMVEHKYPKLGEPIDEALEVVHDLMKAGHKIILYTMRSREGLAEAVEYLEEEGVELYGVNDNKTQHYWTKSPKIFCNIYIDDAALGCPLDHHDTGRPTVDWYKVRELLVDQGDYSANAVIYILTDGMDNESSSTPKEIPDIHTNDNSFSNMKIGIGYDGMSFFKTSNIGMAFET